MKKEEALRMVRANIKLYIDKKYEYRKEWLDGQISAFLYVSRDSNLQKLWIENKKECIKQILEMEI